MTTTGSTRAALAEIAAMRRDQAEGEHAKYPQYRGHWDGWRIVEVTRKVRTKMGVAFEAGDLVLCAPETHTSPVAPRGKGVVPYAEWPTRTFATCYSYRNGIDTSVPVEQVREVPLISEEEDTVLVRHRDGLVQFRMPASQAGAVIDGEARCPKCGRKVVPGVYLDPDLPCPGSDPR